MIRTRKVKNLMESAIRGNLRDWDKTKEAITPPSPVLKKEQKKG